MFVVLNAVSERCFRDIDSSVFKEGHQVISSNLVNIPSTVLFPSIFDPRNIIVSVCNMYPLLYR